MQKAKETAADMAASAKAGMEKAKATVGGTTEKMTTRDPMRKEMAEEKKDERILEAEREKQGAYNQNAAATRAQQGGAAAGGMDPVGGEGVVYDDDMDTGAMGTRTRGARTRGTYGTRAL